MTSTLYPCVVGGLYGRPMATLSLMQTHPHKCSQSPLDQHVPNPAHVAQSALANYASSIADCSCQVAALTMVSFVHA